MLLTTVTPPEASHLRAGIDRRSYDESDYLVDRRALSVVTVVERYSQISIDEFNKLQLKALDPSRPIREANVTFGPAAPA